MSRQQYGCHNCKRFSRMELCVMCCASRRFPTINIVSAGVRARELHKTCNNHNNESLNKLNTMNVINETLINKQDKDEILLLCTQSVCTSPSFAGRIHLRRLLYNLLGGYRYSIGRCMIDSISGKTQNQFRPNILFCVVIRSDQLLVRVLWAFDWNWMAFIANKHASMHTNC